MPRLIHTESRTEAVVFAVNDLLASGGPAALSIRAIARVSGVSGSSLLHHDGSRRRIVHLSAMRTGRQRIQEISSRLDDEGAGAFLPADADGIVDARIWLGWTELWRSDDVLLTAIERYRSEERSLLAFAFDFRVPRDDLDALVALIDGLLVSVCSPIRPMALLRAREILSAQVSSALERLRAG